MNNTQFCVSLIVFVVLGVAAIVLGILSGAITPAVAYPEASLYTLDNCTIASCSWQRSTWNNACVMTLSFHGYTSRRVENNAKDIVACHAWPSEHPDLQCLYLTDSKTDFVWYDETSVIR